VTILEHKKIAGKPLEGKTYQLSTAHTQDPGDLEKPYISEYQTYSDKKSQILVSLRPFSSVWGWLVEIVTAISSGSQ
jgi:hypothetical protein